MQIIIKSNNTLKFDDFEFKCVLGKNGKSSKKKEGDQKTPKGIFSLGSLFYRKDRIKSIQTKLKKRPITKKMGWCDDVKSSNYNKLINVNKTERHEKLFRKNNSYDLIIPINYNSKKPKKNKGSAIFIHLTNSYKKTLGCVALNKKDLLILLKLINKNTKIKIS